jgi:hypothetical protein
MAVAARNMLRMERMNEGKNLNLEQLDLNHFRRQESVHSGKRFVNIKPNSCF